MKKWISLLLVLALCCSLFVGCGEEKGAGKLSVGFGKVNITPDYSLPLDGYEGVNAPALRWSNSVDYPLYALFIQEKELTVQTEDGGAQKVYLIGFSVGDFAMVTAPFS